MVYTKIESPDYFKTKVSSPIVSFYCWRNSKDQINILENLE